MRDIMGFFATSIAFILIGLIGLGLGGIVYRPGLVRKSQQLAVMAGVGCYVADPKTGDSLFVYRCRRCGFPETLNANESR